MPPGDVNLWFTKTRISVPWNKICFFAFFFFFWRFFSKGAGGRVISNFTDVSYPVEYGSQSDCCLLPGWRVCEFLYLHSGRDGRGSLYCRTLSFKISVATPRDSLDSLCGNSTTAPLLGSPNTELSGRLALVSGEWHCRCTDRAWLSEAGLARWEESVADLVGRPATASKEDREAFTVNGNRRR